MLEEMLPEHRLLWAILERAILDATGNVSGLGRDLCGSLHSETKEDAEEFIADVSMRPYSFKWICEQLGIDPRRVRSLLLYWLRNGDKFRGGMSSRSIDQVLSPCELPAYTFIEEMRPKYKGPKRKKKINQAA